MATREPSGGASFVAYYPELPCVENHKSLTRNDNPELASALTGYNAISISSNALRCTGVGLVSTVSG